MMEERSAPTRAEDFVRLELTQSKSTWKEKGSLILPSHAYEVYDRYKLGKRLGNKRRDYKGFDYYDSPTE